jgi:hypothetical protein
MIQIGSSQITLLRSVLLHPFFLHPDDAPGDPDSVSLILKNLPCPLIYYICSNMIAFKAHTFFKLIMAFLNMILYSPLRHGDILTIL